jgi:hypothetical protein
MYKGGIARRIEIPGPPRTNTQEPMQKIPKSIRASSRDRVMVHI